MKKERLTEIRRQAEALTYQPTRLIGLELVAEIERTTWQPIATAPKDGTPILATFKGQFGWVTYIAHGSNCGGYASPDYWMPLPEPPDIT